VTLVPESEVELSLLRSRKNTKYLQVTLSLEVELTFDSANLVGRVSKICIVFCVCARSPDSTPPTLLHHINLYKLLLAPTT
jgi:hypothetical protein